MFLRNVSKHLEDYTVLRHRRSQCDLLRLFNGSTPVSPTQILILSPHLRCVISSVSSRFPEENVTHFPFLVSVSRNAFKIFVWKLRSLT
jgi:hypothetical protein